MGIYMMCTVILTKMCQNYLLIKSIPTWSTTFSIESGAVIQKRGLHMRWKGLESTYDIDVYIDITAFRDGAVKRNYSGPG